MIFTVFLITSLKTGTLKKIPLSKIFLYGMIYPIAYSILMYAVPFLAQVTIYGFVTNLNPYIVMPVDGDGKFTHGQPL